MTRTDTAKLFFELEEKGTVGLSCCLIGLYFLVNYASADKTQTQKVA